ncbi:hypothetical protein SF12_15750 [Streptomyces sp. MBRL 601]|nr:hypothetical protein SF12_15750 [Streptomyces sp. MBRL 601]
MGTRKATAPVVRPARHRPRASRSPLARPTAPYTVAMAPPIRPRIMRKGTAAKPRATASRLTGPITAARAPWVRWSFFAVPVMVEFP